MGGGWGRWGGGVLDWFLAEGGEGGRRESLKLSNVKGGVSIKEGAKCALFLRSGGGGGGGPGGKKEMCVGGCAGGGGGVGLRGGGWTTGCESSFGKPKLNFINALELREGRGGEVRWSWKAG